MRKDELIYMYAKRHNLIPVKVKDTRGFKDKPGNYLLRERMGSRYLTLNKQGKAKWLMPHHEPEFEIDTLTKPTMDVKEGKLIALVHTGRNLFTLIAGKAAEVSETVNKIMETNPEAYYNYTKAGNRIAVEQEHFNIKTVDKRMFKHYNLALTLTDDLTIEENALSERENYAMKCNKCRKLDWDIIEPKCCEGAEFTQVDIQRKGFYIDQFPAKPCVTCKQMIVSSTDKCEQCYHEDNLTHDDVALSGWEPMFYY